MCLMEDSKVFSERNPGFDLVSPQAFKSQKQNPSAFNQQ